jgi:phosphoribosylformimino-5-aminoimidazole carboxamide ribotide isomerase
MRLIPVIDLKNGVVVHAQRGQRDTYQPINSLLSPSADIYAVIDAFLQLADFKIIYIADLNAITQQGNNQALIHAVLQHYPFITFWLDCGYITQTKLFEDLSNYRCVLGSECYNDNHLPDISDNCILSLDFSAQNTQLGSKRLFNDSSLWSNQVIIMTLARVGSNMGPDINRLYYYQQNYPHIEFIAAGGVRNITDLQQLKAIGINSVLIASALHTKTINQADIDSLNQE